MEKNLSVVIVAGGNGRRMQNDTPKQFLLLGNEPVLMHTVRRFASFEPVAEIVVVLPSSQQSLWEKLCRLHAFDIPHTVVTGGDNRFESVRHGLQACNPHNKYVAVHDGVRPFVSPELLRRTYTHAVSYGNAVPAVPVTDTLRRLVPEKAETRSIDRSLFRAVQTPQIFRTETIRAGYRQPYRSDFTDDSSVVERLGETVHLSEGDYANIKLTTPLDLLVAEQLLAGEEREKGNRQRTERPCENRSFTSFTKAYLRNIFGKKE